MNTFHTLRPGLVPYRQALNLQQELLERRRHGSEEVLILLQHTPVVTLGRGADDNHLLASPADLAASGIDCQRTGRGGDVTFHGPGQSVGYPIIHLNRVGRDLHRYLRLLETVLGKALERFDIEPEVIPGKTGLWVDGEKVASIGVAVRHWIAWHGWSLNVGDDLSGFDAIVPCGLNGVRMTSLERLLGREVPMATVENALIAAFAETFDLTHAGAYDCETHQETGLA